MVRINQRGIKQRAEASPLAETSFPPAIVVAGIYDTIVVRTHRRVRSLSGLDKNQ